MDDKSPIPPSTLIAGREVPIQAGEIPVIAFSCGDGGDIEAGQWEFWTVFDSRFRWTARSRKGSDPGERFRMMEGVSGYEGCWQTATRALGIRPATPPEVIGWLNSHVKDTKFATTCRIGSLTMEVVSGANGYALR